jgi:alanyl-tRNA synthetase
MTRVQFVCGVRALRDYRQANQSAKDVAAKFSVARDDAPASVQRLIEESKIHTRRIREMAEKLAVVEAAELLERAEMISPAEGNIRLVRMVFEDRGLEEIKLLAHRLVAHEKVIALLAAQAQDHTRLVLARSPELRTDMNQLMRKAAEMRGWRGGGKPDFVQGGGQGTAGIDELLGELQALLK